eukprot:5583745-Prymnesium_polylepis.1
MKDVDRPAASAKPLDVLKRSKQPVEQVVSIVLDCCTSVVGSTVDADTPLSDAGVDSIAVIELVRLLGGRLGMTLSTNLVLDFSTPSAIARHLMKD